MPWLERGKEKPAENLLFIHVPRCGGTSLMKSHDIANKVTKGGPWYRRFFMKIFFTRYELLEKNNFPIWTEMNAACLFIFIIGCFLLQIREAEYKALSIAMIAGSFIVFFISTYVLVAPTICRVRFIRRLFLCTVEYLICQIIANTEYITGSNLHGYLPHLTAHKIIDYGYVSEEEFDEVSSFAIVRNPYARMVSIYMYNRFGPWESFSHFVRSWYNDTIKDYREKGELEEWFIPCHAIPQFEFTHNENGTKQLVHSVVKQEEIKYLKKISISVADYHHTTGVDPAKNDELSDARDAKSGCTKSNTRSSSKDRQTQELTTNGFASIRCLPGPVRRALLEMPHENKRKTKIPWYEYYDQETLNLTYEMYHRDFEIFNYDVVLEQRPDLRPPKMVKETMVEDFSV
mmetsp:Transcript_25255/g.69628  ORF Transcript_25255/g.69628 Transcript_25255/m.69628 type:complete len:403 (-) Transcript_25255:2108-3316(-)